MKSVFFFSLMSLTTLAWSAADWKVVAESTSKCKDKYQVLAKEGEKFVYVVDGNLKTKLEAEKGAAYSDQNAKAVTFSNESFTFTQPSMVDPNPAKLEVSMSNQIDKCKMSLK